MAVMKEETVPSSVTENIEEYVPTSFIVEDYSEEVAESSSAVMDVTTPHELNIAQEVFIDHDQVTYEVRTIEEVIGFDVNGARGANEEARDVFDDGSDNVHEASLVFYREQAGELSTRKSAMKKRRGRPPKFQVSEIGIDGKKWYSCTVCNEKHEDRMELMQHMRQHNAERPFHCRECGKAFKQAAHLKVHVRQHTGEKPFECTICGKGFRQKAIVDQHMRTHTQLRPYACSYENCDKSFAQKTSLDNHLKSHLTGRLSEAFRKHQEEQKQKSIIAQEAIKNKTIKAKAVQILPGTLKKKSPSKLAALGLETTSSTSTTDGQDKVRTTVVKMTQAQFEQYLQSRAAAINAPATTTATTTNGSVACQSPITSKQKTATGPFLAYVNLCKPLLQSERPELSLLEVLKELASRWNSMKKSEKQKFAIIAKESEEGKAVNSSSPNGLRAPEGPGPVSEGEELEVDAANSMAGAVFEIGEAPGSLYQVDKQSQEESYFQVNEIRDKSLNQNVFGKRVVLLSKDGHMTKITDEEKLQVVTNFDSESITPELEQPQAQGGFEAGSVLQFEDTSSENTVVYENAPELEIESTIFYLPNIVGEEQLEEVL